VDQLVITEEIVTAPALIAGEWRRDGLWQHRTGPYLRRPVSRAVQADPDDVDRAARYARDAAPAVARLAPAARADVLDRAAKLASASRSGTAAARSTGSLTRWRSARPRAAGSAVSCCRWRAGAAVSGTPR
jgi:acyl-CoA reductase-like NAD-dependent aldehyde dehydrogenase